MHKHAYLLSLALMTASVEAEVYKCTDKAGKTVYQSSPCQAQAKQQQLNIQSNPTREADAKAKLQAVQSEYEARKSAQKQAEKVLSTESYEAAKLEIARRNAIAQEEQAEAQKRQAEALENQNQQNNRPLYVLPPANYPHPKPTPFPQQQKLDHSRTK